LSWDLFGDKKSVNNDLEHHYTGCLESAMWDILSRPVTQLKVVWPFVAMLEDCASDVLVIQVLCLFHLDYWMG
jgi:hypothetical protein